MYIYIYIYICHNSVIGARCNLPVNMQIKTKQTVNQKDPQLNKATYVAKLGATRSVVELTACSTALAEQLTVPQLLKKFPALYGTRMFIIAFTKARHPSLSWVRSSQTAPASHSFEIHFILSYHLLLGFPNGPFSQVPHQNPVCTFPVSHTCYMPRPSHSSRFDNPNNI